MTHADVAERIGGTTCKLALSVAAVAAILLLPGFRAFNADLLVRDLLVRGAYLAAPRPPFHATDRLLVVLVDDETRRRASGASRFEARAYLAVLVSVLARLPAERRPAGIGINLLLDEPATNPNSDEALEAALRKAASAGLPLVLATRLVNWKGDSKPILPLERFLVGERITTGHATLLRSSTDGAVRKAALATRPYGPDNIAWFHENRRGQEVRHYYLKPEDNRVQLLYPSFAAALLRTREEILEHPRLHSRLLSPQWIEFPAPAHEQFEIRSAYELFEEPLRDRLSRRIVVVGAGFADSAIREKTAVSVATPLFRGAWAMNSVVEEDLPAVLVQAYVVDTFRSLAAGRERAAASEWLVVFLSFAVASAVGLLAYRARRGLLLRVLLIALPAAHLAVAAGLFTAGTLDLPISRPIAVWLLTTAAACWYFRRNSRHQG